ncbi:transmembrane protein 43-like [Ptychodera flava]|uniref:transmembrane protein 43-like n=1 Tax=Ptychodera flava TaxID=63121 RepID=UPI00396A7095
MLHVSMKKTIGDVRIRFSYSGVSGKEYSREFSDLGPPQQVSVIAKQIGSHLVGYENYDGEVIELLEFGKLSAEEIFEKEENSNSAMAWSLRIVGFLMTVTSIILSHHVLLVIVSWMPIVRELTKLNQPTFIVGISVSLTLHVIGLAWVVQRPLWTLVLIIPTLIPLFIALQKKGYKRAPTKVAKSCDQVAL